MKYLGLHGSSYDQDNIGTVEFEIIFLVEFSPMGFKEYAKFYFGLEKELVNLFYRNVGILDIGNIILSEMLQRLKKRKTDIYKA